MGRLEDRVCRSFLVLLVVFSGIDRLSMSGFIKLVYVVRVW